MFRLILVVLVWHALCLQSWAQQAKDYWPKTQDPELLELAKKKLTYYSHEPAYQNAANNPQGGLHTTKRNPGIPGRDPHGHANGEFPWSSPAGLHESNNFKATRFVYLPGPITYSTGWYKAVRGGDRDFLYVWNYPTNTVFVEALTLGYQGKDYLWQLRTRTKTRSGWVGKVYSPFTSGEDVRTVVEVKGLLKRRLVVRQDNKIIDRQMELHEGGTVHPKVLQGLEFKRGQIPLTTKSSMSIVPKGYVGIPSQCSTCHRTVLQHAFDLEGRRDWYGRVRGSDETFSFHIFDPASISRNGMHVAPRLNQQLVKAGLLKRE